MIAQKVKEFTSVCNEGLPEKPVSMTREKVSFLRDMVNSEFDELLEELDVEDVTSKIIGQYDAICDMLYYIGDACVKQGMNIDEVFQVVHEANLRKIVDGKVIKNERGKVLKPEGWYGPEKDMEGVIKGHLENGSW